jgi:membrane-bound lytic murein transglycosylase F
MLTNKTKRLPFFILYSFIILLLLVSCGDSEQQAKTERKGKTSQTLEGATEPQTDQSRKVSAPADKQNLVTTLITNSITKDTSDWKAIKKRKSLRIIVPYVAQHHQYLPRNSLAHDHEYNMVLRFAEAHKLSPIIVTANTYDEIIATLEQGYGDIIVANMSITEKRKQRINFSYPITHVDEQLIIAADNNKKFSSKDFDNLTIGVKVQTSFWDSVKTLQEKHPKLIIKELDPYLSPDSIFDQMLMGSFDATLKDSNQMELISHYRQDIKSVFNVVKERSIAWGIRKNNPELLTMINHYIKTEKLSQHLPARRLGDLDKIKQRRQLRLITRNNASTYFLWKNRLMGFEYDLIKKFAKQQDVNLQILVADNFAQMFKWLDEGYGDIISAGLIKTPERTRLPVIFTEPYQYAQEVIVQKKHEKPIERIDDLAGRTVYVRKSSSYWNTVIKLQHQIADLNIVTVPEEMETETIIQQVIGGHYDLTLADSHIVAIENSWHNEIQDTLKLTTEQGHRWILRQTDKQLQQALNKFIKKQYKGLFYNVTYNKYFKNSRNLFDIKGKLDNNKAISDYDDLIKTIAQKYNFDWRLISAQVNKESRFNPKARSWAGARGLLQVMPRTAREVGIKHLEKPENGLRAGMKYMDWIYRQLSDDLPVKDRMWFTLAAYNAGLGHLKDARRLAVQKGYNPNRWFDNVEKAFLLLSQKKYAKKARYGYVRGIEPVTYVRTIQALYELYTKKHADILPVSYTFPTPSPYGFNMLRAFQTT